MYQQFTKSLLDTERMFGYSIVQMSDNTLFIRRQLWYGKAKD